MNKLTVVLTVLTISGCASQEQLMALPEDVLCYSALTNNGFTPTSTIWAAVSARGIDCGPYRAGARELVESRQRGLANAAANWNAAQQQQQQQMLYQQQQQAPVRVQPFNCYANNQPYGPAFVCR